MHHRCNLHSLRSFLLFRLVLHLSPGRSKGRPFMKFRSFCSVSAVALFFVFSAGGALADPKGLWLAQDGVKVRVGTCGQALCARVAAPKSPIDPDTGRALDRQEQSRSEQTGPAARRRRSALFDDAGRARAVVGMALQYRGRQDLSGTSARIGPRDDQGRRLRLGHLWRPQPDKVTVGALSCAG